MLFGEYTHGERRSVCLHKHVHVGGRENEMIVRLYRDETCQHLKRKEVFQGFWLHSNKGSTQVNTHTSQLALL